MGFDSANAYFINRFSIPYTKNEPPNFKTRRRYLLSLIILSMIQEVFIHFFAIEETHIDKLGAENLVHTRVILIGVCYSSIN